MPQRHRSDHYSRLARQHGYPARSVYKLEEIQKKYRVVRPGMAVLDLGASPGSWSLYVLGALRGSGSVTAVDIKPEPPRTSDPRLEFLHGDMGDPEILRRIHERGPYDLIMSDAAPSTTGNKTVDTARSLGLAELVLSLAEKELRDNGNVVVKVFQGADHGTLMQRMRGMFRETRQVKPAASRKESFELFFVGLGRGRLPVV